MVTKRKVFLFVLILCNLLQLSPIRLRAYAIVGEEWQPAPFNLDAEVIHPVTRADLDGNGIPEEVILENGQASLTSDGIPVWESPSGWQVTQALMSDLNFDDKTEFILLVRRPHQPWPVDQWLPYGGRIEDFQDASGMSSHIILIGWKEARYREIWAGSSMSQPTLVMAAADLNQDGRIELVTMEGTYDNKGIFPGKAIKLWEWNGFGFSLLSSLPGDFNNFMVFNSVSEENTPYIIAY